MVCNDGWQTVCQVFPDLERGSFSHFVSVKREGTDRDISIEFRALVRVSDLNNFWFGFRYLNIGNDTHTDGVEVKVDMSQLGPTVGWAFTF